MNVLVSVGVLISVRWLLGDVFLSLVVSCFICLSVCGLVGLVSFSVVVSSSCVLCIFSVMFWLVVCFFVMLVMSDV